MVRRQRQRPNTKILTTTKTKEGGIQQQNNGQPIRRAGGFLDSCVTGVRIKSYTYTQIKPKVKTLTYNKA